MKPTREKVTTKTVSQDGVLIKHSQILRQSHNYQSAEVMYGVEIRVKDTPAAIASGIDRAEEIVEERLISKADTHRRLLRKLPTSS